MPEVPHPREQHRHPLLVGGGDHLVVALAAAGLDHGGDPRPGQDVQAVAEGEEGVRGGDACPATGSCAFSIARRQESTRLIWPAPMPTVWSPLATTMAFDLT